MQMKADSVNRADPASIVKEWDEKHDLMVTAPERTIALLLAELL